MSEATIAEDGYQLVEDATKLGGNPITRAVDGRGMPIAAALRQGTSWLVFIYTSLGNAKAPGSSVSAQNETDAIAWLNYLAALHVQAERATVVAA